MRANVVIGTICILCLFLVTACSSSSGPANDFLDSDLKPLSPPGFNFDSEVKMRAFIDSFNKYINNNEKGKWLKDKDAWLYKIKRIDKATDKETKVALQFIKISDGSVLLNRVVLDGVEATPENIFSVYADIVRQIKSENPVKAEAKNNNDLPSNGNTSGDIVYTKAGTGDTITLKKNTSGYNVEIFAMWQDHLGDKTFDVPQNIFSKGNYNLNDANDNCNMNFTFSDRTITVTGHKDSACDAGQNVDFNGTYER